MNIEVVDGFAWVLNRECKEVEVMMYWELPPTILKYPPPEDT